MKVKIGNFEITDIPGLTESIIFKNEQFSITGSVFHSEFDNRRYLPAIKIDFNLDYDGSFIDRINAEKHISKLLNDFFNTISELNSGQKDSGQLTFL